MEIFVYLKNSEPIKPGLYLDNTKCLSTLEENKMSKTGHDIYYILNSNVRIDIDHFKVLFRLNKYYKFYWECPCCKEFVSLLFDDSLYIYLSGWCISTEAGININSLCYCQIEEIKIQSERNKEKFEIDKVILCVDDRIVKNIGYINLY